MTYYIYKTTNLINRKIYIGFHKSKDIENDKYLGSGTLIIKAIKKYGAQNFKREILFEFNDIEEALLKESELVNLDFIKDDLTYNLVTGGRFGKSEIVHNKNKISIYSKKLNKILYIEKQNLEEFIDLGWELGSNFKNRLCIIKDDNIKYIKKSELEKYLKDRWIKGSTTSNTICVTHKVTNKLKYIKEEELKKYELLDYELGNKKSGVNKETIYISKDNKNKRIKSELLEKYLNDGWKKEFYIKYVKIKRMYNPITSELKNIKFEECQKYSDNGWIYGTNYSTQKNTIFINKNKINKRIKKEELEIYLNDGWIKGVIKNS